MYDVYFNGETPSELQLSSSSLFLLISSTWFGCLWSFSIYLQSVIFIKFDFVLGMKFSFVLLLQLTAVASVKVQHIYWHYVQHGWCWATATELSTTLGRPDVFFPTMAEETCTHGDVLNSVAGHRDVCVTSWELPSVCEESTLASSPYACKADDDKCWQFQITDASIKFALLHQQASLCSASRQRRQSQLEKCVFWR